MPSASRSPRSHKDQDDPTRKRYAADERGQRNGLLGFRSNFHRTHLQDLLTCGIGNPLIDQHDDANDDQHNPYHSDGAHVLPLPQGHEPLQNGVFAILKDMRVGHTTNLYRH
jgi:hypothetical protein